MSYYVIVIVAIAVIAGLYMSYQRSQKGSACCGEHESVQTIKAKDHNRSHYQYRADVDIQGMTCAQCAKKIENAFHVHDGYFVKASIDQHHAEVLSKAPIDDQEIRNIITQAGYVVSKITKTPI